MTNLPPVVVGLRDTDGLSAAVDLLVKRCVEIDGHYQRIPNAGPEPAVTAAAIRTVLASRDALLDDNARLRAEVDRWISAYEIAHDQASENGAKANSLRDDKAAIFDLLATLAALPALRCKNTLGEAVRQYRQALSHHPEGTGS